MEKSTFKLWIGRLLVGGVLLMNLQAALLFMVRPEYFAPSFELGGAAGSAAVRGIGILFLMWNVPYFVALINPVGYRVSLYEASAMQAIGVVGESLLLLTLPAGHPTMAGSIIRFVVFDSLGLLALLLGVWITSGLGALVKNHLPA